jgi:hypothetical protein
LTDKAICCWAKTPGGIAAFAPKQRPAGQGYHLLFYQMQAGAILVYDLLIFLKLRAIAL